MDRRKLQQWFDKNFNNFFIFSVYINCISENDDVFTQYAMSSLVCKLSILPRGRGPQVAERETPSGGDGIDIAILLIIAPKNHKPCSNI